MAIPGYPIIHGDGQLSITAAGVLMIITVGNGSPDTNGGRHGLTGATVAVTTHGHRLGQASVSVSHSAAAIAYLMIIGFALRRPISVTRISTAIMCHAHVLLT